MLPRHYLPKLKKFPLRAKSDYIFRMARNSAIEWTQGTWNPATGCTKISAGGDHCYVERFSEHFRGT